MKIVTQLNFDRLGRASSVFALSVLSLLVVASGCHNRRVFQDPDAYASTLLREIEYPQLCDTSCNNTDQLHTHAPPTIGNYLELEPWELTLESAVEQSLRNSKVIQKLGGRVVATPAAVQTIYDPAIQSTNPQQSVEAALSAFDAQFNSSYFIAESSQVGFAFGPGGGGGGSTIIASQSRTTALEFSKQSASGTRIALRNNSRYADNGSSVLPSTIDTLLQAEIRQPFLRGLGTEVNRIAGPNATPGIYNGVLIARINHDITLADFETSIRDLIRDVELSYWELYFAYRNLDALMEAREAARQVWENRKARFDNGLGRPDEEAQARQQYFNFETQVENALSGVPNGSRGVFGAERELRRMIGAATTDGTLIRPITEPVVNQISLDWENAQSKAMERRVELRRQKWVVRQRELEMLASKKLNRFQLDFVGQYGYRGIEPIAPNNNDLFGIFATDNFLENWNLGVEFSGPIGKRAYHVAERNAELRLVREKALLLEQQRQIMHDLNSAYTEVDRAFASIKSNYNNLVAVEEELEPKRRRAEAGEEEIFFLLDAQQRATNIRTTLHRTIVDYNIALLNFGYASGDLLDRYQISLAEGSWCDDAYCNQEKLMRNSRTIEGDYQFSETQKVTAGPYAQQTADIVASDIPAGEVQVFDDSASMSAPIEDKAAKDEPAANETDDLPKTGSDRKPDADPKSNRPRPATPKSDVEELKLNDPSPKPKLKKPTQTTMQQRSSFRSSALQFQDNYPTLR